MAKTPTHYNIKVRQPFEVAGITFRPGASYTVKTEIRASIIEAMGEGVLLEDAPA